MAATNVVIDATNIKMISAKYRSGMCFILDFTMKGVLRLQSTMKIFCLQSNILIMDGVAIPNAFFFFAECAVLKYPIFIEARLFPE